MKNLTSPPPASPVGLGLVTPNVLPLVVVAIALSCLLEASGSILISDDFTSTSVSTTTDGFRLRESSIDNGWQAARGGGMANPNFTGPSEWTIAGGSLSNSSTQSGNPTYPAYIPSEGPVAQAISLGGLGIPDVETQLVLSFDYAVGAGDTFYVTFWGHTGTFDTGSADIISNLEVRYGLNNEEGGPTDLDAFNLLDGATTGFGGTTNALTTLAGGTSGTFTTTIDLATLGITGVNKVNDLSVLTLGFGKAEDGNAGTTSIENLSLTATAATAVPEASEAALAGLAALGLLGFRRRKR